MRLAVSYSGLEGLICAEPDDHGHQITLAQQVARIMTRYASVVENALTSGLL